MLFRKKNVNATTVNQVMEQKKEEISTKSNEDNQKYVELLKKVNSLLKYITELDYIKDMLLDVNKQAEMVEGIAASSEEMTASIDDISNYVQNSHVTTNDSIKVANESLGLIDKSFSQLEETFDESKQIQLIMDKLSQEAMKIDGMVTIIKGVADQTNLLALNASIEAARAGEHGRGFAVVADEIKKLADSTKEQVDFIKNIVDSLTSEIDNTGKALEHSNKSFDNSKKQVNEAIGSLDIVKEGLSGIGDAFVEISANVQEQTAASEEMSSSVMIVNEKTQVLREETDNTGRAFNEISKIINDIRLETLAATTELDVMTQIEICISDHLVWRWRVYNMILGYENLNEKDVGTHHTCRLGKWCDGIERDGSEICGVIDKMAKPHSELHNLAKQAIKEFNSGDREKAEQMLELMDAASKEVVQYLNKMKELDSK